MNQIRLLSAAILLLAGALAWGPAGAAEPVFPPGSRVGMTPLAGLVAAKTFVGFETEQQGVKVLVAELPADAYGQVSSAFKANPAGSNGIKPETIETAAGLAYYTAENAKDGSTSVRTFLKLLSSLILNGSRPSCSSTGTCARITADANI